MAYGYHMNVKDLYTMRTYSQYIPQCGELFVLPESICNNKPKARAMFMRKGKIVMAQLGDQLTKMCNDSLKLKKPPWVDELANLYPTRCEAQFPAEVGYFDVTLIANTTTRENIVQHFLIKV